jgi:hypothetical protein
MKIYMERWNDDRYISLMFKHARNSIIGINVSPKGYTRFKACCVVFRMRKDFERRKYRYDNVWNH